VSHKLAEKGKSKSYLMLLSKVKHNILILLCLDWPLEGSNEYVDSSNGFVRIRLGEPASSKSTSMMTSFGTEDSQTCETITMLVRMHGTRG